MRSDYKTRLKAIAFISLGIASLTTMSLILVTAATFIVWVCMCIYNRKIANLAVLACSLLGVVYQLIFYILMSMLIYDMKNLGPKQNYFKFRGRNNWWLKWFG